MRASILAITGLFLAACEGEPPKTPANAEPAAAAEPATAATPSAEEPETEQAAPARPAALPPCACVPAVSAAATGDAGAPADAGPAPAAVASPAPPATPASVSGDVTTTPKGAAANTVVYLEDAPVDPSAKMTAVITNHMMTFSPFVAVVPVGGKIVFRNDDPFPHNVFSSDNERFNMGNIAQHEARQRVFKTAGAYSLLCNLHPGMLGYAVVTPSSYYAKTNGQGHFLIKNVPPGTYKITAWAPRVQPATQSVTVKDGDATVTFDLHR